MGVSSTLGRIFRVTTWGESHGPAVGVVVDGCPPRVVLSVADIQAELDRRRPGQSAISSQRQEPDRAEILSGVFEGRTLGTPISIVVHNTDAKSKDYEALRDVYRPSHADFTYERKFGIRDHRGGGRASARETVGRVAASAVAKKVLAEQFGVEILAWVSTVWQLQATIDAERVTAEQIATNAVRCPDAKMAALMLARIEKARRDGDSVGGIVECVARGVPPGWGEPVFDKLEAELGRAVLSIPACKAFEVGSGFGAVKMTGAEHNDIFFGDGERIRTRTNHSGGIQGGISNGESIVLRAGFKPTATIMREQPTVDRSGAATTVAGRGRHDPCVLPRAVPVVEAMVALVLVDQALRQRVRGGP